jgi:hypothetical protein
MPVYKNRTSLQRAEGYCRNKIPSHTNNGLKHLQFVKQLKINKETFPITESELDMFTATAPD